MVDLYPEPVRIPVPGGKIIDEHIGLASTGEQRVSVAHMVAPAGWDEPFQTPEFDEFTVVLRGQVIVEHGDGERTTVDAGQSVRTTAGERIRYSCGPAGADYLAVCLPAFNPETAHRDE
ncbi:cupin domain-containing protein [Flexivirga sp. ID2601S]|uniref:Cupin domain-containing protein n=1 Tax=Flexivirga aerilata TaxID=1656889 RepID=A0A849AKR0_9MICO|nr:cupin domain-containing protein [Flexivirga aerilata]NNG40116.1 cupin domain-containing protein [Flexivirga aerilata]